MWFLKTAPDSAFTMTYGQFKEYHTLHPAMLHSALLLQQAFRVNTMGESWWHGKMVKYKVASSIACRLLNLSTPL